MAKIYNGENIRSFINANKGKWITAETENYIIIYPAPALHLRPLYNKAIVFTMQLVAANPGKYPGGAYKAKQYTVSPDRNTLPEKYKAILRAATS